MDQCFHKLYRKSSSGKAMHTILIQPSALGQECVDFDGWLSILVLWNTVMALFTMIRPGGTFLIEMISETVLTGKFNYLIQRPPVNCVFSARRLTQWFIAKQPAVFRGLPHNFACTLNLTVQWIYCCGLPGLIDASAGGDSPRNIYKTETQDPLSRYKLRY